MASRTWTAKARVLVVFGVLASCGGLILWLLAAKSDAKTATSLSASISLLSFLVTVLTILRRPYDLGHEALRSAADGLSRQVREEWERTRHRLLADTGEPPPADVGYVRADGDSSIAPALVRWRSDGGSDHGSLTDIAAYYAGLKRGRLVILGEPGAGKTVLAIQLLLDLIAALPDSPGGGRLRVPVLLSASSWQVSDVDADDSGLSAQFDAWLIQTLTGTYRIPEPVSKALVTHGWILPILDGLDEIDPDIAGVEQPLVGAAAVVRALNQAPGTGLRPVVMTCRRYRYDQLLTAGGTPGAVPVLQDATAVIVQPLSSDQTIHYLTSRFPGAAAGSPSLDARWNPVRDELVANPGGALATALSTPWRLFVAVTAYHDPATQLDELAETARGSPDKFNAELLGKLIPEVTRQHPRPGGRNYDPKDVERWLRTLASRLVWQRQHGMSGTNLDLQTVWQIAGQRTPRYLHAALVAIIYLACTLIVRPSIKVAYHLLFALTKSNYLLDILFATKTPLSILERSLFFTVWFFLIAHLATRESYLPIRKSRGRLIYSTKQRWIIFAFALALALALLLILVPSARFADRPWSAIPGANSTLFLALTFGLPFGLAVGLTVGLADKTVHQPANRFVAGIVIGLVVVFAFYLQAIGASQSLGHVSTGMGIVFSVWLVYGFTERLIPCLVVGFLVWLLIGLAAGLQAGIGFELVVTLVVGLAVALAAGLVNAFIHGSACRFALGLILNLKKSPLMLDRPSTLLRDNFVLTFLFVLAGGLIYGAAVGLVTMLALGVPAGLAIMFRLGPVAVLEIGLPIAFGISSWPRFMIANMLVARRRDLPARVGSFLDWAYDAGLLRLSGIECQFRHEELQRRLVGERDEFTASNQVVLLPGQSPSSPDGATSLPMLARLNFTSQEAPPRRLRNFPVVAGLAIAVTATLGTIFIICSDPANTIIVGTEPYGVAVSPDGRRVYVANSGPDTVSVIDSTIKKVISSISVGSSPGFVVVSSDGRYVFITNRGSNTVSVIETAANKVVSTIPVGTYPMGVAVSSDGRRAYVTNGESNTVSVIDAITKRVIGTILVGTHPIGVAVSSDGRHAYAANSGSSTVSVIDTMTQLVTNSILVGTHPDLVVASPDGRHAYVTNNGSNAVSVIDTTTNTIIDTIPVGASPIGVAVSSNGRYAYVANSGSNAVSVIDTMTKKVAKTISVEAGSGFVAVSPDGRHAYVTSAPFNTVSVIDP